jgi:glycosyltransferase involved in cell wall biosynthesis
MKGVLELPLVSVLITTYNASKLIPKVLDSIVEQSYKKIQIVIIDDQSTDNTVSEINNYISEHIEATITFAINPQKGRGKALNYGISLCKGLLIAINDSDDFSLPLRIETQVNFLNNNPEYGLVGTYSSIIDLDTGEIFDNSFQRPIENKEIRKFFVYGQPIQHVTAMFRKSIIEAVGGYNEKITFLFDRDIFLRCAQITKLHNIPTSLVLVGEHTNRYFQYSYVKRERFKFSMYYKFKAIHMLNLPKYFYFLLSIEYLWGLIPEKFRNLIKT